MYAQLRRSLRLLAHSLRETGNILRKRPVDGRDIVTMFLWWKFMRAVFHRGYVLASGLYFVSQAEPIGEIIGGFALAVLAQAAGISIVLIASGVLMAFTGLMVARSGTDRAIPGSL